MASMRVLILESDASGHRLQYVRVCVQAIADLGVEIVFATNSSTPRTDEFRTHIGPVIDRITIDPSLNTDEVGTALRSATTRVMEYGAAMKRHSPDHVYVPYADGFAQISGLGRLFGQSRCPDSVVSEGILMRGRFAYPRDSWRDGLFGHAWLTATSLSPIDILHFLDPIPYERIMERGGRLAAKARLIPEPVEAPTVFDRQEARRHLGLPAEGRLLCCPGVLGERKGVDRLIRAFAAASATLRPDDCLLLIGRVDDAVREAIRQARGLEERGRIILREGVASDADLHRAMAAAHVVAAPYPRHTGSSGTVVRAAALERMVLSSDFGWLGMVTNRFKLGLTCDCRDDAAIARSLPIALEASESFRASPAARRFAQFHTQVNFEHHLARRLRERLGRDAYGEARTWDWVLQAPSSDATAQPQ